MVKLTLLIVTIVLTRLLDFPLGDILLAAYMAFVHYAHYNMGITIVLWYSSVSGGLQWVNNLAVLLMSMSFVHKVCFVPHISTTSLVLISVHQQFQYVKLNPYICEKCK